MFRLLAAAAILAALAAPAGAQAPSGKVTILTSFSKDVTEPFKKAFEKAHPAGPGRRAEPQHQRRREVSGGDEGQQPGRHLLGLGARTRSRF